MDSVLSLDNPLIRTYIFYMGVLGLKVLAMSLLTGYQRYKTQAFSNPEDVRYNKGSRLRFDENVERVRRAHLNDLEGIPVFMIVSLAYVLSDPSVWLATMLFRVYTAARIMHTLVYAVLVAPQPARFFTWSVGLLITIYMSVQVIVSYITAM